MTAPRPMPGPLMAGLMARRAAPDITATGQNAVGGGLGPLDYLTTFGRGVVDYASEHPVEFGLGFVPVVGDAIDLRDFGRAMREGDALGMGLAAASLIPGVPRGLKAGTDAVKQTAKAAKRNLKKTAIGADKAYTSVTEALAAARRGDHLKQDAKTGQYIGAPRGIDTPGKLGANRVRTDAKVEEGLFNADWYNRARHTANDVTGYTSAHSPAGSRAVQATDAVRPPFAAYGDEQWDELLEALDDLTTQLDDAQRGYGLKRRDYEMRDAVFEFVQFAKAQADQPLDVILREWKKTANARKSDVKRVQDAVREHLMDVPGKAVAEVAPTPPTTNAASRAALFARGTAAYSPQAKPDVEVNAFIRQHNAKMITGKDVQTRTGAQMRNVARAYGPDGTINPDQITLGRKTGPYANAKDPTVPEETLYNTASDIWHARVMGYTNPDGSLFKRGLTPQEHGFLTGENLLLGDRAARRGLRPEGAADDFQWNPRSAQAATWGAERKAAKVAERAKKLAKHEKAMATYERAMARWEQAGRPKGKRPERPAAPRVMSDAEIEQYAQFGIDDATARLEADMAVKYVPGVKTGHLAGLSEAGKAELSAGVADVMGPRHPVLQGLGLFEAPKQSVMGEYLNSAGDVERNLSEHFRPIVGTEASRLGQTADGKARRGGHLMDPVSRKGVETAALHEAIVGAQESVGVNKFTPANSAMLLREKTGAQVTVAPGQADAAKRALEAQGLDVVQVSPSTLHVGAFGDGADGKVVQAKLREAQSALPSGTVVQAGRWENDLVKPNWGAEGSGQVTTQLLEALDQIPDAAARLDRAGVPAVVQQRAALERALAAREGVPLRADQVKLQDILSRPRGHELLRRYVRRYGAMGLPAVALGVGLSRTTAQPGEA